jgi:hypothetical protein
MEVTTTFKASIREEWRSWLIEHHESKKEIRLTSDDPLGVSVSVIVPSLTVTSIHIGWVRSSGVKPATAVSGPTTVSNNPSLTATLSVSE